MIYSISENLMFDFDVPLQWQARSLLGFFETRSGVLDIFNGFGESFGNSSQLISNAWQLMQAVTR